MSFSRVLKIRVPSIPLLFVWRMRRYSSTRTILSALAPRLHAGAVLVFDELFNYAEYRQQ